MPEVNVALHRRGHPRTAALAAIVLALAPATAQADRFDPTHPQVITLEARSDYPRAVVLADGTVVVQWFHNESDIGGGESGIDVCRIPPGAGGCDAPPTRILGGGPDTQSALLVPDPSGAPNTLHSVTRIIDGADFAVYVRVSDDGGRTFAPAVRTATNRQLGEVAFIHGPGAFQFSSLGNSSFQAAPYDPAGATTTATALLQPTESTTSWQGIGLADSTSPVAVFENDPGGGRRLETRRFTGAGSVNDPAAWSPTAMYTPPRGVFGVVGVGSGPRGLFVAFNEKVASGCGPRFVTARYDGTSFGAPVAVDGDAHAADVGASCDYGSPSAPGAPMAFTQDPAGNLRALWTFNRINRDPTTPDGLYTAVSVDGGQSFTNPIRLFAAGEPGAGLLLPNHNGTGIVSNAGGDAVVLGRGTSDSGAQIMRLPSIAAAVAQPGSPCSSIAFGAVRAIATVGCFTKRGNTWTATGPVRVNGIDLAPASAGGARAAAAPQITFDRSANTIVASGTWRASASAIDLGRQKVNWYAPPAGGQLLDASTREPARLDAAAIKQRVLGLPVTGMVLPSFLRDGTARLPMNLQLPSPLGGLTGGPLTDDVTLTTDNGVGVRLGRGALSIELPSVSLGIAEISPFKVSYQADPFVFEGDLGIKLPLVGAGVRAHLLLRDGEFIDATAEYSPPPPGVPITGFAYLTKIGLHVHKGQSCADPTALEVSGRVTAGPKIIGDAALLAVNGTAGYKLPEGSCNRPGVFRIDGVGELVGLEVAKVFVQFVTDGTLSFGAFVKLGTESTHVGGGIDGAIAFATGDFFARGQFDVKIANYSPASATAVIGSVGIGACASVDLDPLLGAFGLSPTINGGIKYRWGDGLKVYLANCDVSDLIPGRFAAARAAQAGAPPPATVTVAPQTKVQTFLATTAANAPAPQFTLVAPDGKRYVTATAQQGTANAGNGAVAFTDDALHQASITVTAPRAGTWRLEPGAGSPAFASVEGAAGGDPPRVTARVRRVRGRTFALSYRAQLPHGARVTFFDAAGARLALPRPAGRGTIRFVSKTGRRGRRAVIARVEGQAGPLAAPVVAQFSAPGPVTAGRARRVQLLRGKGRSAGLRVAWRPATGAVRYVVRAALRDGRRIELPATAGRRVVVIPRVPGFDTGRVSVYAVGKDGRAGPAATARLKAVKPKRKRRS